MTEKPDLGIIHKYLAVIHCIPYDQWTDVMRTEYAVVTLLMQRSLSEAAGIEMDSVGKLSAIFDRMDEMPPSMIPDFIAVARERGLIH